MPLPEARVDPVKGLTWEAEMIGSRHDGPVTDSGGRAAPEGRVDAVIVLALPERPDFLSSFGTFQNTLWSRDA